MDCNININEMTRKSKTDLVKGNIFNFDRLKKNREESHYIILFLFKFCSKTILIEFKTIHINAYKAAVFI